MESMVLEVGIAGQNFKLNFIIEVKDPRTRGCRADEGMCLASEKQLQ